jgi:hypothetical protein
MMLNAFWRVESIPLPRSLMGALLVLLFPAQRAFRPKTSMHPCRPPRQRQRSSVQQPKMMRNPGWQCWLGREAPGQTFMRPPEETLYGCPSLTTTARARHLKPAQSQSAAAFGAQQTAAVPWTAPIAHLPPLDRTLPG